MPVIAIAWKFEQDKLNAAIAERIKVQGKSVRTFAQIVNTALWSVAVAAQKYTPATDSTKIDASLFVDVNLVTNKMGQRVPARKGNRYSYKESAHPNEFNRLKEHFSGDGSVSGMPPSLAFAIVLARANISRQGRLTGKSLYNRITNDRWQLTKDQLRGGKQKILAMMERMVSARHSSSGLLKAGWKPAIDILRPFIAKNDIGGRSGERFAYNKNLLRLGTAKVAKEGWYCSGYIENHVGQGGTRLDDIQQRALLEYGTEPLRRALAQEADKMYAYIEKHLAEEAAAFNRRVR